MPDPLTVAFVVRRPWPRRGRYPAPRLIRWKVGSGMTLHWPSLVTVWHRDPSGVDDTTCPIDGRWRLHVHHWRLQIHPWQRLRRSLLTRCDVCAGRSTKSHPVVVRRGDRVRVPWWHGEQGLTHTNCYPPEGT